MGTTRGKSWQTETEHPDHANPDVAWAIREFQSRRKAVLYYKDYYSGRHMQMISSERLQNIFGRMFKDFRINLCSSVVDALADRLQIAGFTSTERIHPESEAPDSEETVEETAGTVSQDAHDIWERNRMRRRSGHVHQEGVASGDAYVLVWPDPDGEPTFYPQSAHEVVVSYDLERSHRITKAAKMWREGTPTGADNTHENSTVRMNLYYPDRVEKYYATQTKASAWPKVEAFSRFDPEGNGLSWTIENKWGVVPIFHFANSSDVGEYGVSELVDAVPVQDALNYKYFSLLVGVEFVSLPQRYIINVEDPRKNSDGTARDAHNPDHDPMQGGADRLLAFTGLPRQDGPDVGEHPPQIGQLAPADLDKFRGVIDLAAQSMATVTGTPVHHFLPTTSGQGQQAASGESQKTSDAKLQSKVVDRQISFGDTWAEAMALAVRMKRGTTEDPVIITQWEDTRPRNELEAWHIVAGKIKAGMPWQFAFKEQGYTDEQIQQFQSMKEENAASFGPPGLGGTERTMGDVLDDIGID